MIRLELRILYMDNNNNQNEPIFWNYVVSSSPPIQMSYNGMPMNVLPQRSTMIPCNIWNSTDTKPPTRMDIMRMFARNPPRLCTPVNNLEIPKPIVFSNADCNAGYNPVELAKKTVQMLRETNPHLFKSENSNKDNKQNDLNKIGTTVPVTAVPITSVPVTTRGTTVPEPGKKGILAKERITTEKDERWKIYKHHTKINDIYQRCFLINFLALHGYNIDIAKVGKGNDFKHPGIIMIEKDGTVYYDSKVDKSGYIQKHGDVSRFNVHNAKVTNNKMLELLEKSGYEIVLKGNCRENNEGCECFNRFIRLSIGLSVICIDNAERIGKEVYLDIIDNQLRDREKDVITRYVPKFYSN